jgi:hypothetical protein
MITAFFRPLSPQELRGVVAEFLLVKHELSS